MRDHDLARREDDLVTRGGTGRRLNELLREGAEVARELVGGTGDVVVVVGGEASEGEGLISGRSGERRGRGRTDPPATAAPVRNLTKKDRLGRSDRER